MINQAIFWKTMRDSASLLIAAAIGIVLFLLGSVCWWIGMVVFCRKDIATA